MKEPSVRQKYQRERDRYEENGQLEADDRWGEDFASNASGTGSDASESENDDSEHEDKRLEPNKFRLQIYNDATP